MIYDRNMWFKIQKKNFRLFIFFFILKMNLAFSDDLSRYNRWSRFSVYFFGDWPQYQYLNEIFINNRGCWINNVDLTGFWCRSANLPIYHNSPKKKQTRKILKIKRKKNGLVRGSKRMWDSVKACVKWSALLR